MIPSSLMQGLIAAQRRQDGAFWGRPGATYEGKLGPWSTMELDERIFPGAATTDDPKACSVRIMGKVRYRVDVQKGRGQSGHKLNVEGYEPEPLTILVRLWREEQWAAFRAWLADANPKLKANKRRAFKVRHPYLDAFGIQSIYINEIDFPTDGDHRQIQVVKMQAWEVFDLRDGEAKPVKQIDINADGKTGLDPKFNFEAKP